MKGNTKGSDDAEFATTRVISKTFQLEGIQFSWWAVDESPAFVTVSSQWFGSRTGFANKDPEAMAHKLAESIVRGIRPSDMPVSLAPDRAARRTDD